jgi:hypothetical protein
VQDVVEDLKDPLMFEEIETKVKFKFSDLETGRDEGTQVRAKVLHSPANLLKPCHSTNKSQWGTEVGANLR